MKTFYFVLLSAVSINGFAQNQLFIPPVIEDSEINLTLQEGTTTFFNGITTNTMGANGDLLGPTLIMHTDSFVSITVDNQLSDTTTIHWHGMHVAPEDDGGPHSIIPTGTSWNPEFTVMDRAGLFWYHPHLHMHTDKHVSKGIAGMIIVKDAEEAALTLPGEYGLDDFPLVLQTKGFDATGQIEVHTEMDTAVMVNGTIDPYLDVPAQVVRFRVLAGSSQRVYNFGISDGLSFELIGTDGGLLEAPVTLTRYQMAPGQRADILVDLTGLQGQNFSIMSYASELGNAIYGAAQEGMMPQASIPGYDNNPLNGNDFELLSLNVVAQTSSPVVTIPSALVSHIPWLEANADTTRTFLFQSTIGGPSGIVGPFTINGSGFDMSVINETIPLGNTEIWELTNPSPIAHPFHIHDVQFYILDINGTPPPVEMQGLNDVVLVPAGMSTVRFITQFNDFADTIIPYMYHCHMLTHEDEGMMGQFIVVDTASTTSTKISEYDHSNELFTVYPNPTSGEINITNNSSNQTIIHLSNSIGQTIFTKTINGHGICTITDLSKGVYFVRDDQKDYTSKIVVN